MKVILAAFNARYVHSSLAIRYLVASCLDLVCEGVEIELKEYTINDRADWIAGELYRLQPDVLAMSCYIWNIEMVLKVAALVKLARPSTVIVLGGPEVSYDGAQVLKKEAYVDFVLSGEGEKSFRSLLIALMQKGTAGLQHIKGLAWRREGEIVDNGTAEIIQNLDSVPTPYQGFLLEGMEGKIGYLESSRGCPFNCSYCLSSTTEGVRYFPLERVKQDICTLLEAGVRQIKFVDRTFNCNRERAMEIFSFILSLKPHINFHFEIAADLLDERMLDFLSQVPPGLFQFEAGVQTANFQTLRNIHRKSNLDKIEENVRRIVEMGNIHVHLDLIAGLPGEDLSSFRKSFGMVYRMRPHRLQLGFLKLLKGSSLRQEAPGMGYVFSPQPPYEVIRSDRMEYSDLLLLKDMEEMLELYGNSGRFPCSVMYLEKVIGHPFDLYRMLAEYWRKHNLFAQSQSGRSLYWLLAGFALWAIGQFASVDETEPGAEPSEKLNIKKMLSLIKMDWFSAEKNPYMPEDWRARDAPGFKEECFEFLKQEKVVSAILPHFAGMPPKEIYKQLRFERLDAVFDPGGHACNDSSPEADADEGSSGSCTILPRDLAPLMQDLSCYLYDIYVKQSEQSAGALLSLQPRKVGLDEFLKAYSAAKAKSPAQSGSFMLILDYSQKNPVTERYKMILTGGIMHET